jgi:hypothetical protein
MARTISGLGDEVEDSLNERIGNAFGAREGAECLWAEQYWDTVLSKLLRKANRLEAENLYLN